MNNLEKDISEMKDFRTKYKKFKSVIEDLYIVAIIDTYERLKFENGICLLTEPNIRNKIQVDFEHNNDIITEYINNETITFHSESQIIKKSETFKTDMELFCSWFRKSFIFECKKFNPYNNEYIMGRFNNQKKRYEYNGIERFTECKYAEKDNYAGMIGFICSGKIEKITKNLNHKVKNFRIVKNSEKLLNQKCVEWEYSFQSKHIRKNNTEILMYHLFFDFVKKNNSYERF